MKRLVGIACTLALISVVGGRADVHAADWAPASVPSGTQQYITPCTTSSQLDCIESVGAYINGTLVAGTLTGRTSPTAGGGVAGHEWKIPGLTNEDGQDLVESQVLLTGDNVSVSPCTAKCLVGIQGDVHATSRDGFRPQWESQLDTCTTGRVNGVCSRFGNLQTNVRFAIVVRTSWVLPSIISSKNLDSEVKVEQLATSGASRITLSGVPHRILGVDPPQMTTVDSATSRGAWASRNFAFTFLDGRQFAYYTACAAKPALLVADNTWGPSVPTFDKNTGAFDLKVRNPHFDTNNSTLFEGAYQARIPLSTAQCLWGDAVKATTAFDVQVFESTTGATKTATSSASIASDIVSINSTGFTFSSPTVRVVAKTGPVPKRPTGVMVTPRKGSISLTLTRVKSVTYRATATSGAKSVTLSCKNLSSTKVSCSKSKLTKGTWKISITPSLSGVAGTAYTKSVRVP